jgi:putative peptidoglycan lipid II flippase
MSVGSISVLSLAYNLQSVPLSIIGVSYSLAAFPKLSNLFVTGEREKFVQLVRTTARYIIFFSMPLIALFVVLRAYIVRVVIGSGAFNWHDTRLTAAALALFVVSLAAQGLILIFTRARYASGNTRTPFYINIAAVGVTMCSAVFFTHFSGTFPQFQFFIASLFRVEGILDTTVLMLPLAFSIGSIFGAVTHVWTFDRDLDRGGTACNLVAMIGKLALVAIAMGFAAYITLTLLGRVLSLDTFMGVFAQGLIAGICGVITGIMLLVLLRSPELAEVFGVVRRRIWNTPVIGPDPENL